MLSPAHTGSTNSNSGSSNSEHESSDLPHNMRHGDILEPRSVADFMVNLGRALDHQFYVENPGREDVFQLVDDCVGPNNKRHTVFYVAHGPTEVARRLTRIEYTLPVGPIPAILMFGGDGETTLPAVGPDFTTIDVPEDSTAEATVAAVIAATLGGPAAERLASWGAELIRVSAIRDDPAETPARRQGSINIIRFWEDMRTQVHAALFVHIQRPGMARLASPPPALVAVAEAEVEAEVEAPVATSSSERRRRSRTPRRNRNRSRSRRVTGDPNNGLGYERNAVTGKLTRRRRPNSDPK